MEANLMNRRAAFGGLETKARPKLPEAGVRTRGGWSGQAYRFVTN